MKKSTGPSAKMFMWSSAKHDNKKRHCFTIDDSIRKITYSTFEGNANYSPHADFYITFKNGECEELTYIPIKTSKAIMRFVRSIIEVYDEEE